MKLSLQAKLLSCIRETSSNVSRDYLAIQTLPLSWFSSLNDIMRTQIKLSVCTMICILGGGGGQLRYELLHIQSLISPGRTYIMLKKKVQMETWQKHITIIPIIISSDKTQLTTFCGKQVYPVYLTISNLPKHICQKPSQQGQVLLGYLPDPEHHLNNTWKDIASLEYFTSVRYNIIVET